MSARVAIPLLQDRRFLLLGPVGRGGMASVWRAFDRVEERVVALKVPHRGPACAGPSHPLAAEFEACARVRHPNVVEVYELRVAGDGPFPRGAPYLVLEHIDGAPLDRRLARGRVAPAMLERIAIDVLGALAVMHAEGWVHRDVKPANLLLESGREATPRVRLIDFGLASPAGERRELGRLSGSLAWIAPETILGSPVDPRADLYGLGLVLFRLATGDGGGTDWVRWHLAGPPADPRRLRPRFPAALARFVRRLTERDPAARPADAGAALAMLGHAIAARDPWPPEARAARAELRLALDAVRLGARRRFPLPEGSETAGRLRRLARVWAQVHGLGFHVIGSDDDPASIARLVSRVAIESAGAAIPLAREHRLERHWALVRLGSWFVPDPQRDGSPRGPAAAEALASFVLGASALSPGFVIASRSRADRPARGFLARLARDLAGSAGPHPGRGGLLLVEG